MSNKQKLLTVRVDEELDTQFKGATEYLDTTVSQAIRAFMKDYIKKAHKQKLADNQQQISFGNLGGE